MIYVFLLLLVFLTGIGLLFLGYRGRRIDDHFLCRKCRYDLTELPATSQRCPECGANVRAPNTTRLGNRQRRGKLLAAGWFVVIPALLLAGTLLYVNAAGISLIHYKPLAMLRRDIENPAPATAEPALAEISRRMSLGRLTQADLAPIVDDILKWQADPAHRWNLKWGNLIEQCAARSLLPKSQWEHYLSHAVGVRFLTNDRIHSGTELDIVVQVQSGRFDSSPHPWATPIMQLKVDWKVEAQRTTSRETTAFDVYFDESTLQFLETSSFYSTPSLRAKPPEGTHQMKVDYTLTFTYVDGTTGSTPGTQSLAFEVMPPGVPLVLVRHDPAAIAAMRQAIVFSRDSATPSLPTNEPPGVPVPTAQPPAGVGPAPAHDLVLHQFRPPFRGMFTLELVQGDLRWPFKNPISMITFQTHTASKLSLDREHTPAMLPHPGPAEIVLTPDPDTLNPHATNALDVAPPPDTFGEVLRFPVNLVAP